jgi:APA family basic amino acid/polyamine antiporter
VSDSRRLTRKLGLADSVFIGLGSMIGAGVFAAFAPAASAAGSGLLVGLFIAAAVAYCNASSSGQLAAQYPTSGGTFTYARHRLGVWPGFLAGWSFVIGKTASCAAMALTFAAYAAPAGWERPVAVIAVAALVAVNYVGVTRTVLLAKVLVVLVLVVLALVVSSAGISEPAESLDALFGGLLDEGWFGILQSAGLLFFAFAGYARIATLGEEVRDPARTIPRAILIALAITVVVYCAVAAAALASLGADGLASSTAPLADAVSSNGWAWAVPLVGIGAAAASLGALLALLAGVGRTTLAMARERELPSWLGAVHPRFDVPHRADVLLGVVIIVIVLVADIRSAIGFSSFGVLLYYFLANASALTQDGEHRTVPRFVQILGGIGCLALVATLPFSSIVAGVIVLLIGVAYRLVVSPRLGKPT